jgi:hypothetical protein
MHLKNIIAINSGYSGSTSIFTGKNKLQTSPKLKDSVSKHSSPPAHEISLIFHRRPKGNLLFKTRLLIDN